MIFPGSVENGQISTMDYRLHFFEYPCQHVIENVFWDQYSDREQNLRQKLFDQRTNGTKSVSSIFHLFNIDNIENEQLNERKKQHFSFLLANPNKSFD